MSKLCVRSFRCDVVEKHRYEFKAACMTFSFIYQLKSLLVPHMGSQCSLNGGTTDIFNEYAQSLCLYK